MELIYQNLATGMAKDEALRQAKLTFLSRADRVSAAPYFWGGVVLIGNTQPLQCMQSAGWQSWWFWCVGAALLGILVALFWVKIKLDRNAYETFEGS